jgi:hypothetical protein
MQAGADVAAADDPYAQSQGPLLRFDLGTFPALKWERSQR